MNVGNTSPTEVDMPMNEAAPEEDNNVVIPVPIPPTALGTAPHALLMMAATTSVVDVPLIESPPVQPEEEIHDPSHSDEPHSYRSGSSGRIRSTCNPKNNRINNNYQN
jgi:hypothetical protein